MLDVRSRLGRLRRPVRASVGFTAVGILSRAAAVLSVPLFTRYLTPAEFGLYAVYTARLSVVSVLSTWNLSGGIVYRGMQRAGPVGRDRFLLGALGVSALPYGLCGLVLLIGGGGLLRWMGLTPLLCTLMMAQIAVYTVLSFFAASCRFTYRPLPYALVQLPMAVLTPLLGWLLTVGGFGAYGRIVAPLPVGIVGATVALMLLWRAAHRSPSTVRQSPLSLLGQGITLLPYTLSLVAVEEGARLMLNALSGTAAVGAYGIAHTLGGAPLLLLYGINGALQPWIVRRLAAQEEASVGRVLWLVSVGMATVAAMLTLLSPELVALLAPAAYGEALRCVGPIAVGVLPHGLCLTLTSMALHRAHTGRLMLATVAGAVLSLSVGYILVSVAGTVGAAWLTPLSYTVLAGGALLAVRQRGERVPLFLWRSVALLLFLAAGAAVIPWLYAVPVLRVLLCLLLLGGAGGYLYRSRRLLLDAPKHTAVSE